MTFMSEYFSRISYLFLNDKRYFYYDKLKKNLFVSRDEMLFIQNNLIKKLVKHAYSYSLYYKKLFDNNHIAISDIDTKEKLCLVPVLTKDIIRHNLIELATRDDFGSNMSQVTSGGSTGNQSVIYKSRYFDQIGRAFSLRNNLLANWMPGDKSVWIWGAPYEHQKVRDSLKSKIGLCVNQRLLLNAYCYSREDFISWVDKIQSFKPKVLYGYSSIVAQFAQFVVDNHINFDSIKSVVTTTEKLNDKNIVSLAFKCNIYNQYGCREIPAISIEDSDGIMHISDDNVALNINEKNEIILTALHSYGFPLINYKLGDCGYVSSFDASNSTLPFTPMKLTIGRVTDNFLNKFGYTISSSAISTYISTLLPQILEHQIIQTDFDNFIINCVPLDSFEYKEYELLMRKVFLEYFGNKVNIVVNIVERIPVESSGKKLLCKRTFNYDL